VVFTSTQQHFIPTDIAPEPQIIVSLLFVGCLSFYSGGLFILAIFDSAVPGTMWTQLKTFSVFTIKPFYLIFPITFPHLDNVWEVFNPLGFPLKIHLSFRTVNENCLFFPVLCPLITFFFPVPLNCYFLFSEFYFPPKERRYCRFFPPYLSASPFGGFLAYLFDAQCSYTPPAAGLVTLIAFFFLYPTPLVFTQPPFIPFFTPPFLPNGFLRVGDLGPPPTKPFLWPGLLLKLFGFFLIVSRCMYFVI